MFPKLFCLGTTRFPQKSPRLVFVHSGAMFRLFLVKYKCGSSFPHQLVLGKPGENVGESQREY